MLPVIRYTATATGRTLKHVGCERCGREYGYMMRRRATGTSVSRVFVDLSRVEEDAIRHAQTEVAIALRTECDDVPCPACGHYQTAMIPAYQSNQLLWMWRLAIALGVAAVVSFFSMGAVATVVGGGDLQFGMIIAVILVIGLLEAAVILLVVRRLRVLKINPNKAVDEETRKEWGRRRALNRTQFLRAFYPERLNATTQDGAPEDAPLRLAVDGDGDDAMSLEQTDGGEGRKR